MPARRSRRGVTLIEAVLFISVALGLIVGGLVFYRQAQTAALTQRTVALYSAILVELRGWHERMGSALVGRGAATQTFLDMKPVLIASGGVPANAINETRTDILSPWGAPASEIGVARSQSPSGEFATADRQILLSMCDVPVAVCTRLLHFDAAGKNLIGDGLVVAYADSDNCAGGDDDADVGGWWVKDGAISPGDAGVVCAAAPPPGNRLVFVYSLK